MLNERTNYAERAITGKSARGMERATLHESAIIGERATAEERTNKFERASGYREHQ
jgi:hypothetical protein